MAALRPERSAGRPANGEGLAPGTGVTGAEGLGTPPGGMLGGGGPLTPEADKNAGSGVVGPLAR